MNKKKKIHPKNKRNSVQALTQISGCSTSLTPWSDLCSHICASQHRTQDLHQQRLPYLLETNSEANTATTIFVNREDGVRWKSCVGASQPSLPQERERAYEPGRTSPYPL
jgi:hypothetical protein